MAFLKSATCYGQPIEVDRFTLTPISQALRIRPQRIPVGLLWDRPVGVLVQHEEGEEVRLPIVDVTRKVLISVFLLTAAMWFFVSWLEWHEE